MIWLLGHKGMLGTEVANRLQANQLSFLATDKEVDISSRASLTAYLDEQLGRLRKKRPEEKLNWIVNCAAYTAVDKAEDEPELAERINSVGAGELARLAAEQQATLLHISTDYVFDGSKTEAYVETDPTAPLGAYGRSKLNGEIQITGQLKRYYIIRTAWLYGCNGTNFVHTMLRLFKERPLVKVVDDQWGSPTYAGDLAEAILAVITQSAVRNAPFGIYHFSNEGRTNWHQFALEIYKLARIYGLLANEVNIQAITSAEYPTKVIRPKYSYLSKDKIKAAFGLHIRGWQAALEEYMKTCVTNA
jgi:dTDP-4-dehydrorhamnose reductase